MEWNDRDVREELLGHMLRIWQQCVNSSLEHLLGVVLHQGCSLDVEIPKHLIRSPSADEADDIGIYIGK